MNKISTFSIITIAMTLLVGCDSEGVDSNGGHYQGQSCAQCHSSGENHFISGATVFTNLNATNSDKNSYAVGYKIQLGDSEVYNGGRGNGNSFLITNRLSKFTAKVIDSNGNIVNSSIANSHDSSRLDCNRCHTSTGINGAPGRILNKKL